MRRIRIVNIVIDSLPVLTAMAQAIPYALVLDSPLLRSL